MDISSELLHFHLSTNQENVNTHGLLVDLVVANCVKENRLAVLHFYLSRISQSRSLNFFCNVEIAHAHGCQVGGIKQTTGQKMYRFIKKELLLGGFKLLKSGNCNHKSFGGLIPIKNNANEIF